MNGPTPLYEQSARRGALLLIASAAVFSLVGTIVKHLAASLPLETVVFFRNGAGLLFLFPVVLASRTLTLRTNRFGTHMVRAVAGVIAMYCFFYAIKYLHLAEAIVLNFTSPLLIPLLAYLMLRERVTRAQLGYLIIGFMGVLLIVKPGSGVFNPIAFVGMASAFFAAFALVNIRKLTYTEPVLRIVFYFSMIASCMTLIPMLRVWVNPDPVQWALLLLMGGLASVGQFLLTRGYASAPAAQVGYFQYSAVVFAGIMDALIWNAVPDTVSLVGVLIITAAGILASRNLATPPPARAV